MGSTHTLAASRGLSLSATDVPFRLQFSVRGVANLKTSKPHRKNFASEPRLMEMLLLASTLPALVSARLLNTICLSKITLIEGGGKFDTQISTTQIHLGRFFFLNFPPHVLNVKL